VLVENSERWTLQRSHAMVKVRSSTLLSVRVSVLIVKPEFTAALVLISLSNMLTYQIPKPLKLRFRATPPLDLLRHVFDKPKLLGGELLGVVFQQRQTLARAGIALVGA
jgi:hypothetical protein